jgi:hypothetical protein
MSKASTTDLFSMRIPSPPPELTGEALAKEVPNGWDPKGLIHADQYLAHLCPAEFDDAQRRQFFCILDLRRLKYTANEVFLKKDWRMNMMNFAKEFEKSRSIIMLRYGLYEFQNVKPTEEVMKKWRAANGLPDPEEEGVEATPSKPNGAKPSGTKRKAEEELAPKDTALSNASPNKNNKRRAVEKDQEPVTTPAAVKFKRKASVSDEPDENQPSKVQKTVTPSATKSLFEKIANKSLGSAPAAASATPTKQAPKPDFGNTLKPNPFAAAATANNSVNGSLARSVFDGLKPGASQTASSDNPFQYLSDASSAKNSGADADAESSTDSEPETETQDAGQSYEPSVAASNGADTPSSQIGTGSLFAAKKPAFSSGLATGPSSTSSEARESTPGRSIFDRITKGSDGQPMRFFGGEAGQKDNEPGQDAEKQPPAAEKQIKLAPADKTWAPNTPIKFAPATSQAASNPFAAASTASSSIFGAKAPTSQSSGLFGPPKQDQTDLKAPAPASSVGDTDKSGGDSDKENSARSVAAAVPAPTSAGPANSPFGSSLFQPKSAFGEQKKDEATGKAPSLFTAAAPTTQPSESKPASTAPPANIFGSTTTFGVSKGSSATQPSPLFSATPSTASTPSAFQSNTLFGATKQPESTSTITNFGAAAATPQISFGQKPAAMAGSTQPNPPTAAPIFNFGGAPATQAPKPESKPLFAPTTPGRVNASNGTLFGGSPMKQDEPSPAKRPFGLGAAPSAPAAPIFSFGAPQSAPAVTLFGPPTTTATTQSNGPVVFGAGSGGGSSAFTFSAGGGGQTVNNPFASSSTTTSVAAPAASTSSGGMFNFSAGPSAPVFGAGSSATQAPAQPFLFGAGSKPVGETNQNKPLFGSSTPTSGASAPTFSFTGASPTPKSNTTNLFAPKPTQPAGSLFSNLNLPSGGASTPGTSEYRLDMMVD